MAKYDGTLGWLAINPWTGDVWDMNKCDLILNPALKKEQANIKERFKAEELKYYDRLHAMKPYRMYDLEPCL